MLKNIIICVLLRKQRSILLYRLNTVIPAQAGIHFLLGPFPYILQSLAQGGTDKRSLPVFLPLTL